MRRYKTNVFRRSGDLCKKDTMNLKYRRFLIYNIIKKKFLNLRRDSDFKVILCTSAKGRTIKKKKKIYIKCYYYLLNKMYYILNSEYILCSEKYD